MVKETGDQKKNTKPFNIIGDSVTPLQCQTSQKKWAIRRWTHINFIQFVAFSSLSTTSKLMMLLNATYASNKTIIEIYIFFFVRFSARMTWINQEKKKCIIANRFDFFLFFAVLNIKLVKKIDIDIIVSFRLGFNLKSHRQSSDQIQ